jgi:hypothetical protein
MASYLIAYDLIKRTEHDYEELWAELRRLKAHKTQLSLWLLSSSSSAKVVHDQLKKYMHEEYRLWVAEFQKGRHMYSNAIGGTNDWISNNPPRECS